MKYVYGLVCVKIASWVHNDCNLPKADAAKATVSTKVPPDTALYKPATLRNEQDEDVLSKLKVFFKISPKMNTYF